MILHHAVYIKLNTISSSDKKKITVQNYAHPKNTVMFIRLSGGVHFSDIYNGMPTQYTAN